MHARLRHASSITLAFTLFLGSCGTDPVSLSRTTGDVGDDLESSDAGSDASAAGDAAGDAASDGMIDGGSSTAIVVGGKARVTASSLNLRTGPGTTYSIVTAMPCGSEVSVVGGPSSGWWEIDYDGMTGFSSGAYLVASSAFDPATCASPEPTPTSTVLQDILTRAASAVGYSYYWGHGAWRTDGTMHGTCSGSCPSCMHSGLYGADCSGFIAKVWQIPTPSPLTTDLHPYSTYTFYNSETHWRRVPRDTAVRGDSLVYNDGSRGHIVLLDSGDPWGSMWTYEARGCSYGIVHNLRTAGSAYVAIRREGL